MNTSFPFYGLSPFFLWIEMRAAFVQADLFFLFRSAIGPHRPINLKRHFFPSQDFSFLFFSPLPVIPFCINFRHRRLNNWVSIIILIKDDFPCLKCEELSFPLMMFVKEEKKKGKSGRSSELWSTRMDFPSRDGKKEKVCRWKSLISSFFLFFLILHILCWDWLRTFLPGMLKGKLRTVRKYLLCVVNECKLVFNFTIELCCRHFLSRASSNKINFFNAK